MARASTTRAIPPESPSRSYSDRASAARHQICACAPGSCVGTEATSAPGPGWGVLTGLGDRELGEGWEARTMSSEPDASIASRARIRARSVLFVAADNAA